MMVANVTAEKVRTWLAPAAELDTWKEAYEAGQWFWLIKQWNDYHITAQLAADACAQVDQAVAGLAGDALALRQRDIDWCAAVGAVELPAFLVFGRGVFQAGHLEGIQRDGAAQGE